MTFRRDRAPLVQGPCSGATQHAGVTSRRTHTISRPREDRECGSEAFPSGEGAPGMRIAFVADTLAGAVPSGGMIAAQKLVAALRTHNRVVVAGADVSGPDCVRFPSFQLPVRAMRDQGFRMAIPRRPLLTQLMSQVDVAVAHARILFTAADALRVSHAGRIGE